jgi:hypothetical protein
VSEPTVSPAVGEIALAPCRAVVPTGGLIAAEGAVTISETRTCRRCGEPFMPRRTGGHRQVFCSAGCRRAHDTAARATGRATIDAERATVPGIGSGLQPTRALQESPAPLPTIGPGNGAFREALAHFRVAIPVPVIEGLIKLRWLRADQQHDLLAILAAMKRLGREPDILRVT